MATLATTPTLGELSRFVANIRAYPVSAGQLLEKAKRTHAPKAVEQFYQSFDQDRVFKDKDDLAAVTEQVEILREEGEEMPQDGLSAPEED